MFTPTHTLALKRNYWNKNKEEKLQTLVALEWEGQMRVQNHPGMISLKY